MKKWILTSAALLSMQVGIAKAEDNVLTPVEITDGFKLLFDGNTLQSFKDNWVDYVKGNTTNTNLDAKWKFDAECHCIMLPAGNTADIRSTKTYRDFELRLMFQIDNNQGIFYRSLITGDRAWQTGVEYAIDNATNKGKDNPGAAYDIFAPDPISYNVFNGTWSTTSWKTNKWNTVRIVVKADSVEHWMNEVKVVGYTYHNDRFWAAYNEGKWNAESRLTNKISGDRNSGYIEEGYLGFQGDHGGKWVIKDLMVSANPCFGPLNANGSSCGTTNIGTNAAIGKRIAFASVRQGTGGLTVALDSKDVKGASILGLDGKVLSRASLSEDGRRAVFAQAPKTGLYFLKVDLASGTVTQKLNLL